jgi:hypothetical protein
MIKLPVTSGTQGDKIIQGVYDSHRRIFWKFLDGPDMADLEVF